MTPPLSPERVGAAFGLADVSVTTKKSEITRGTPVGESKWEYRTPDGFRLVVVVAVAGVPPRSGDTEAVVRAAAGFGDRLLSPQRWLTGIGDHAALSRSQDGVGVAAAARRGNDVRIVVVHTTRADAPDDVVIELAQEAFG